MSKCNHDFVTKFGITECQICGKEYEEIKREIIVWEYFLDIAYFDMYAVRNINDKSFNSAIHLKTKEEAQFLTDSLNELYTLKNIG